MTVLSRSKRTQGIAIHRRPRGERGPWARARLGEHATQLHEHGDSPAGRPPAHRVIPPAPQDRALYSCGCGYVFSQDVSTSVACPHCGGTQAW